MQKIIKIIYFTPHSIKSILLITFLTFNASSCYHLVCEYKTRTDWWAIDNVLFCEQTEEFPYGIYGNIEGIEGAQETNEIAPVKGFRNEDKYLGFFPKNLGNFFPDLEFLAIWSSGLQEVSREDLSPFKDLRVLSFYGNKIEFLEKNLLKENKKLEYIGLGQNKINSIGGRIFNHLENLHTLHFDGNVCFSRQVASADEIGDMIEELNENCVDKKGV